MASTTLLIAAVGEGRLLGCLGYDTADRAAVIDALLVDPEHQGEGVGRSFVDWLKTRHDQIEVAVAFGARELRGFYKELDFDEASHPGPRDEGAWGIFDGPHTLTLAPVRPLSSLETTRKKARPCPPR